MPQPRLPQIWATSSTYVAACGNTGSLSHWTKPGIEPASSWTLWQVLNLLSHSGKSWKNQFKKKKIFKFPKPPESIITRRRSGKGKKEKKQTSPSQTSRGLCSCSFLSLECSRPDISAQLIVHTSTQNSLHPRSSLIPPNISPYASIRITLHHFMQFYTLYTHRSLCILHF